MAPCILIVDDNRRLCDSLAQNFQDLGLRTACAGNRGEALRQFGSGQIAAVLLDIMVGEENGIDILVDLKKADPGVPVIMITGYATVDTAVQALKLGAADYVKKPLDFEVLHKIVTNAIRLSRLAEENRGLKSRLQELKPRFTTRSPRLLQLLETVRKLAATELPVLITGENGTGKELIADALHEGSSRASRKLLKVNCASFPESLLDNELFGHERGSYTGADSSYKGLFEQAGAGTLFLDEIGDMPLAIQAKILRALQNKEIRRIGGTQTVAIDVRFITATNRNVEQLIAANRFREDLYYRLSAAVVSLPPLREHLEDLPELSRTFVEEYCLSNSLPLKELEPAVLEAFLRYPWPGNVRELKNTLNYACAICSGPRISLADLPPAFQGGVGPAGNGLNVREKAERDLIIKTLQLAGFNKRAAALRLAMSRKTLYNKIARYGIDAGSENRA
ncbi:MAG TPA: sigma-54 dependent transcriptional regulator [Anaerolineales bacterium]|nr:sigma-54 dependent transcriptional regulator [Anaerolineales bacterium]